jgi:sensor histidine kinase YesM
MIEKIIVQKQKSGFKAELKKVFFIASGAFIVVTIVRLTLSADKISDFSGLISQLLINLVFSFSITFSAIFMAYYFTERLTNKLNLTIRLLISFIALVSALIVGIYLGQILVWFIGITTGPYFLTTESFWFSFLFSCIIAIVVTVYNGLKEKLKSAYEKIKVQERQKSELELLKTKADLEALQSKINPHFLFNSLNSIAGLAAIAPEKVEDTILKLAELFRSTIKETDTFSSIGEEIRLIRNYLDIEKIRFGNRLNYTIEVSDELNSVQIPHLLIQPLVENAIKHGIEPQPEGGRIYITIKRKAGQNIIVVKDDGVGIKKHVSFGYGLTSINKRLENIYKNNHSFDIESENGTIVSICIPEQ